MITPLSHIYTFIYFSLHIIQVWNGGKSLFPVPTSLQLNISYAKERSICLVRKKKKHIIAELHEHCPACVCVCVLYIYGKTKSFRVLSVRKFNQTASYLFSFTAKQLTGLYTPKITPLQHETVLIYGMRSGRKSQVFAGKVAIHTHTCTR